MSDEKENPMIVGCYAVIAVTYLVLTCAYCGLIWAHTSHQSGSVKDSDLEVEAGAEP